MDKEIYTIIAEYRQRLEALGIKVKKIILYGSYATGRACVRGRVVKVT